jgi:hypothetical protein
MFYVDPFFPHAVKVQTLALVEVFEGAWVDGWEVDVVLVTLSLSLPLSPSLLYIYRLFASFQILTFSRTNAYVLAGVWQGWRGKHLQKAMYAIDARCLVCSYL